MLADFDEIFKNDIERSKYTTIIKACVPCKLTNPYLIVNSLNDGQALALFKVLSERIQGIILKDDLFNDMEL